MQEGFVRHNTVFTTDKAAISALVEIHTNGKIDADVCYRRGAFYPDHIKPRLKYDIAPQSEDCVHADARELPIKSATLESVMFDPPFLVDAGGTGKYMREFGTYPSWAALWGMYVHAIGEAHRVLKRKGKLIVKCQDCVNNHKNHWSHVNVYTYAIQMGFKAKDLAIRINNNAMARPGWSKQEHLRKAHCFYWVFEK